MYSYEEYLSQEFKSETKHEFYNGKVEEMTDFSLEHVHISTNFIITTKNVLIKKNKKGIVYPSMVRIHIPETNQTYYPDASIVCEKPETSEKDSHAIINPVLILEVLSESTLAFDRGAKFSHYRLIPSLKEYVLISQSEALVDTYYRTDDGTWEINTITDLTASVILKSIDCEISMADIYFRVPGLGEVE